MMKHEYEALVKTQVTDSEFSSINSVYMESSLNKVDFCKSHGLKWLVSFRYDEVARYEKMIQSIKDFAKKEQELGKKDQSDKSDKKLEKVILDNFAGTPELYAYNRRIMGLQQSIVAAGVLYRTELL